MPTTPAEWLPVLTAQLDRQATHTKRMRDYCNGRPDLPEMGKNLRVTWEKFQKKARMNYGGLAARALKTRIRPMGASVADDKELTARVELILRDNRLRSQFGRAILDRLETGRGYIVIGGRDDRAVITREKPEHFTVKTDPLQAWRVTHALKVTRDEVTGQDSAIVWVPGQRQRFTRSAKDSNGVARTRAAGSDWEPAGDPDIYDGNPPVVSLEREQALIEPHLDLIDSIMLGKLHRLVITAMQAFKQRALKANADSDGLDDKDEDGNDIDYSSVFEPAPGALWELPVGIDVWESESVDIRPLLEGEKADRRDFAAVSSTPLSVFIPEGANQSAEGAANAKEGHVALAEDEILDVGPALDLVLVYALRAEGADLGDATVSVEFAPPALVSLSEKYAAAAQAKAAGLARRTIMRTVLGMTQVEIDDDEAALAEEQLAAFALMGADSGDA